MEPALGLGQRHPEPPRPCVSLHHTQAVRGRCSGLKTRRPPWTLSGRSARHSPGTARGRRRKPREAGRRDGLRALGKCWSCRPTRRGGAACPNKAALRGVGAAQSNPKARPADPRDTSRGRGRLSAIAGHPALRLEALRPLLASQAALRTDPCAPERALGTPQ